MRKQKILIIDDDPSVHSLLKMVFEEEGFEIMGSGPGDKAGGDAGSKPDAIILDIVMPEVNGFEILKGLKADEDTRHIPVIILSVHKDEEDVEKAIALGARFYLRKPFSRSEILDAVRAVLAA